MAPTSGSSEMSPRKFDGTNFSYWKEQMKDYFIVEGHIDLIENATVPTRTNPEEWNRMDWIAHATIQMHLSKSVYYTVQSCDPAHALWETLLSTYKKKEIATKLCMIQSLYNLLMKESDSITAHLGVLRL